MQVADIMHTEVKSANAEDTFADVAKLMRTNGISSVVVLEGKKLGGIVTERDIVNLVAAGGDPHSVKVAHGMTRRDLETIGPKMEIAEAAEHMATRNIRHLPVVDRGKVVGIVSIRDLTKWAAEELAGGHEMPDIATQPQGAAGRERTPEAASQGRLAPITRRERSNPRSTRRGPPRPCPCPPRRAGRAGGAPRSTSATTRPPRSR